MIRTATVSTLGHPLQINSGAACIIEVVDATHAYSYWLGFFNGQIAQYNGNQLIMANMYDKRLALDVEGKLIVADERFKDADGIWYAYPDMPDIRDHVQKRMR